MCRITIITYRNAPGAHTRSLPLADAATASSATSSLSTVNGASLAPVAFQYAIVVPVRTYMERKGFVLRPTFIFIDGRTGETLHSETFREEILYNANQQTPALSSYFELMDRLLPTFLNTLSAQKIRGTRVLLK